MNKPLSNAKHENFIQAVVDGVPPFKAYLDHCYRGGKGRPSRAQLQSEASRLMGNVLVRARAEELKRERAGMLRLSRERIVEEIERIALHSGQDKVRLEALRMLYQMGGWADKPKVNVKYELVHKVGGYAFSHEGGREKFPPNEHEREAAIGSESEKSDGGDER